MKKLFIFAVFAFFALSFVACQSGEPKKTTGKTFAQTYAELEKQPLENPGNIPAAVDPFETEADREAEVDIAAQQERRAAPPLVESNYIFQVKPEKSTYSFDEYNQPWTDAPKAEDYSKTKRLWTKPQKFKGDSYYADSAAPSDDNVSYQDE
ncbi:MAG: hypothetical protein LBM71_06240 [Elusimicrobiota bacterium]|jgi:hypothetical protein|nr:hypothetical protein [Elusimicrobiota bacterium]